ncbi:MAG: DUF2059 domain-containing protein, partial [Pseudomonadota bacterium]
MFQQNLHYPFIVACLLFVFCTYAQSAPVDDETVTELMQISGLEYQINELPKSIDDSIDGAVQNQTAMQDLILGELKKVTSSAFGPSHFRKVMREHLSNGLSTEDVAPLVAWYNSDVGKRIVASEKQASTQK